PKGSAAALAEAIGEHLKQLRKNPVTVVVPGMEQDETPKAPAANPPADKKNKGGPRAELNEPGGQAPGDEKEAAKPQLADPQKKNLPGNESAPVTISAFGNKIIVTSEDPEARRLVMELIRLYTQTEATQGDFTVIKLKNASAVEAAKLLDEAFN